MRICDVTLEELSTRPDETYTSEQYVEAGRALDRLGVPLIQFDDPGSGSIDAETVRRLSEDLSADGIVATDGLDGDADAAVEAGVDAIEVRVPVSTARVERTAHGSREAVFDAAERTVRQAESAGCDVRLRLTDAFRAEIPAVAGAFGRFDCPIVLADSVGARTPPFVAGFLRTLADASADLTRAGVRFRDDLGCGTANAVVATETGIDRVDASVAGLGRGVGPTATEEIVVATAVAGGDPGVDPAETIPACGAVLDAFGASVPDGKPVLGADATTRWATDETDGIASDPEPFEPFAPAAFGGTRRLRFGERTGRDDARRLIERAGGVPDRNAVEALLDRLASEGPLGLEGALELAGEV